MKRQVPMCLLILAFLVSGCPRRDQPPDSAYDPDLMKNARAIAKESRETRDDDATTSQRREEKKVEKGECNRETGGCPAGYLCWDSYFCKAGFDDECTRAGDKKCHKQCVDDNDCPHKMPRCVEKPIFNGNERGTVEKFCVTNLDDK